MAKELKAVTYGGLQVQTLEGPKALRLSVKPVGIDPDECPRDMLTAAREAWDKALELGEQSGFRNAQVTVIAPTGTIGLLMDCDTTGVEPDFALVKFKKLAGGGYFKIANQSLRPALVNLGYAPEQINDIMKYVLGTLTLADAPHVNHHSLSARAGDELARRQPGPGQDLLRVVSQRALEDGRPRAGHH